MEANNVKEVWTAEQIETAVVDVAQKINERYEGKQIVLIGVLKGAVMFMADLMRYVHIDMQIDFVGCSSYGSTKESGTVTMTKSWELDLDGKHVILVDDIYDTGSTMSFLQQKIMEHNVPDSIDTCVLVKRKDSPRNPTFYAFEAGQNDWIYGYGLDLDQYSRNLGSIYRVDHD